MIYPLGTERPVKRGARIVGFILLGGGTAASVACVVLALIDSPSAPRWIDVFIPVYITMGGAFLVLLGLHVPRPLVTWTTAVEVPRELEMRPRRLTSSNLSRRLIAGAGVAFAGIALVMPAGFYPYFREWGSLRKRGVETTGQITRRVTVRNRATMFFLHYRYRTVSGRWVENSDDVPQEQLKRVVEGQAIPVTYLKSNPQIALAVRRRDLTWGYLVSRYWYLAAMAIAPFVLVPLLVLLIARMERRLERIAGQGRAVVARVSEVDPIIRYEFEGGSGLLLFGRRKLAGEPRVGDGVIVFYDEKDPRQNVALIALDEIRIEAGGQTEPPVLHDTV